jgi:hypothetical protein
MRRPVTGKSAKSTVKLYSMAGLGRPAMNPTSTDAIADALTRAQKKGSDGRQKTAFQSLHKKRCFGL